LGAGGATDCGGDWAAVARSSEPRICVLMSPSVRRRGSQHCGPEPRLQRMEWQSRGRARKTPQPTTARTRTLARKRGSPIRSLLMTRRSNGGIRAAPTSAGIGGRNESRGLRAATGWVATARNPGLARKQPPGHLRFHLAGSAATGTVQGCRGAQAMAREECGTHAPNPRSAAACV
jgi:hypothetical protein